MSRFATSKVMWEVTRDKQLAERFRAEPAAVLAGRDLSGDECAALTGGDVRALLASGIHPFVVYHFALRLAGGFSMPFVAHYLEQVRGLTIGDLET